MQYLGLGKTLFNSSACLLRPMGARPDIELALTERLTRKKASGIWPEQAIHALEGRLRDGHDPEPRGLQLAENRDVLLPQLIEDVLDSRFPFYEHLRQNELAAYSRKFNPTIRFVTHHRAHARAAMLMSPFAKSVILVMDGAGTKAADFPISSPEATLGTPSLTAVPPQAHEEYSVFLLDHGRLSCVEKNWQIFKPSQRIPGHSFSDGLGTLYEKTAEFVFNDKRAAGKVMGLAPFGAPSPILARESYLENLPWHQAFTGQGKKAWESFGHIGLYSDISASVQAHFEDRLLTLLKRLRKTHADFDQLILTGGCALNCTANMKIVGAELFREIYVPPFPGDECIGLGAAAELYHSDPAQRFVPLKHEDQHGYFGPRDSIPDDAAIEKTFSIFELTRPASITEHAADLLKAGHIIGWFQGRSESGPRALGNRSILARPDRPGLKAHLNQHVKFRESFRPYGSSTPHEKAHEYFAVPKGFNNPYMSFAVKTRSEYRELLQEVTHIDGTCRMQTVRQGQNPLFHELLHRFGLKTDLFCLLNTSLNVMGEPIVETLEDAKRFLLKTPVHGLAIGNYYVRKY